MRTPNGIQVDPTGKQVGRGAYLHDRKSCWELALKGALQAALKMELSETDNQYLVTFMSGLPNEKQGE
jgi:hypothetical protein